MDPRVSVVVAAACLKKQNQKPKTDKIAASFVDVQRTFIPPIMCQFMESDLMYLLCKKLESGDTSGLFEEWICVWLCCEGAGVLALAAGGGREEEGARKPCPVCGGVTTSRGSGWVKLPAVVRGGRARG